MASSPIFRHQLDVHASAKIIGLAISVTLALFSAPGQAEDTTASSDIPSGIFSAGTCSDPESWWIHASGISVTISDDFVSMYFTKTVSRPIAHGWQRMEHRFPDEVYGDFARTSKDGDIENLWWRANNVKEPPEDRWASVLPSGKEGLGEHWGLSTWTRCESIPFPLSLSHGEAAAFLFSLEPALRACRSGHSSCIQQMFAAAAVHRDDALSQAEWARLIRLALYFIMIADEGIPADKLGAAQTIGLFTFPLAASAIVSSYDYDGDGKTSLVELARDIAEQSALAIPEIAGVGADVRADLEQAMARLRNLLRLLPDLP